MMKTQGIPKLCAHGAFFLLSASFLLAPPITYVWQHLGGDNKLSTGVNWVGNTAPTSDATLTILSFPISGPENVDLDVSAFAVNKLLFSATSNANYTYILSTGNFPLTLGAGGIELINDGRASLRAPLNLGANQTWAIPTSLELSGVLSGSGIQVTKTGTGNLRFFEGINDSGFSGSFLIQDGEVHLAGADPIVTSAMTLGSSGGPAIGLKVINAVSYDSGTPVVLPTTDTLAGTINVFNNLRIYSDGVDRFATLKFTNTFTLNPSATAISTTIEPQISTEFASVASASPNTVWTLTGGGKALIHAMAGSNLSTIRADGSTVAFNSSAAIPVNSLAGLESTTGGAISLVGGMVAADNNALLAAFLSNANPANFSGALSLDTNPMLGGPATFNPSTFDLTQFTNASFRIGSSSSAILNTAPSLAVGSPYKFGTGGGTLTVGTSLTSTNGILVDSLSSAPLTVLLTGDNTGLGGLIEVNRSVLVFDHANALPLSVSGISLLNSGYASYSEKLSLQPSTFLSNITWTDATAIIGFDHSDPGQTHHLGGNLLFTGKNITPFIGTRSNFDVPQDVFLGSGNDNTLRFAALPGASMVLFPSFSNSNALAFVFGHTEPSYAYDGSSTGLYTIMGENSYTGGTTINSGRFLLSNDSAFGTGAVNVTASAKTVWLSPGTGSTPLVANGISANNSNLVLGMPDGQPADSASITFTGPISGSAKVSLGDGTTLHGINTYTGGTKIFDNARVLVSSATPFGTGAISTGLSSELVFDRVSTVLPNEIFLGNQTSLLAATNGNSLNLSGPITIGTADGTYTGTTLIGDGLKVYFDGNISADKSGATWVIGSSHAALLSHTAIITGTLDPSISTLRVDDHSVFFTSNVPSRVEAANGALIGLSGSDTLLTGLLTSIDNPSLFQGTLSLDTLSGATKTYSAPISIAGFTDPTFRLSSTTSAIVTSPLTAGPDQAYRFGNGGGILFLNSSLGQTGTNALQVKSDFDNTFTLVLGAANTFTGGIEVANSFLILNTAGALPSSSTAVYLGSMSNPGSEAGYISATPAAGFASYSEFAERVDISGASEAVIGFDSTDLKSATPVTIDGTIDFGSRLGNIFIGTRSRQLDIPATTAIIGTHMDGMPGSLGFAAFDGATINLQANLSDGNATSVTYGISNQTMANVGSGPGTYIIGGNNTYNGPTNIRGGSFVLNSQSPFGNPSSSIYIDPGARSVSIAPAIGFMPNLSQSIWTDNDELVLGYNGIAPAGTGLLMSGEIAGSAKLTVNDGVTLTGNNSYSGGTYLTQGTLTVAGPSALGYYDGISNPLGGLTMAPGTSLAGTNYIAAVNVALDFSDSISLLPNQKLGVSDFALSQGVRAKTNVATINLLPGVKAWVSGYLDATQSTSLTFGRGAGTPITMAGGLVTLSCPTSSFINTLHADGAGILFNGTQTLPSFSIQASNGGLIGVSGDSALLDAVVAKVLSPEFFNGTLSLDSPDGFNNIYTSAISQAVFSNAGFRIGSTSEATLATAPVLGVADSTYRFGNGNGDLTVSAALGDQNSVATGISLDSYINTPLILILSGSNTFTGDVSVSRSLLVLNAANPLSPGTKINLGTNGYASYTELTGYSPSSFLSRLTWTDASAIIGFDSSLTDGTATLSEGIDFTGKATTPFIGTRSKSLVIPGEAPLTAGADKTLRFVTGSDGSIHIYSTIAPSNATNVVFGHPTPNMGMEYDSNYDRFEAGTYFLNATNGYTGGTLLNQGSIILATDGALGSGPLTVSNDAKIAQLGVTDGLNTALSNTINLGDADNTLDLIVYRTSCSETPSHLDLHGLVSGAGRLNISNGLNAGLWAANTYSGGTSVNDSTVRFNNSSAFGTGDISLDNNAMLDATVSGLTLANNLRISGFATLSTVPYQSPLSFSSQIRIENTAENQWANTALAQGSSLRLLPGSTLSSAYQGFNWKLESSYRENLPDNAPTSLILSGTTDPSVALIGACGVGLFFESENALPSSGVYAQNGGSIGVSGPGDTVSNTALLNATIQKIDLEYWNDGMLSLDTLSGATANVYGGTGTTIDLTGLMGVSYFSLGSNSKAIIAAGTNLVPSVDLDGRYQHRFGGGGGTLSVAANIGDYNSATTDVVVDSTHDAPLTLVLQGANTFTGDIDVNGAQMLVFDSAGALPSGPSILLGPASYASYTPNAAGLTPSAFIGRILSESSDQGIIGFDNSDITTPSTIELDGSIDLSSHNLFLGTRSNGLAIKPSASITLAPETPLKLVAVQGGSIDVQLSLTNSFIPYGVTYGHPDTRITFDKNGNAGTYTLSGINTYSGPTTIFGGNFTFNTSTPFGGTGVGWIDINCNAGVVRFMPAAGVSTKISQSLYAGNGLLILGSNLTGSHLGITGHISGSAAIQTVGPVTLVGSNSYSGTTTVVDGVLSIGGSNPVGSGQLIINTNRQVQFVGEPGSGVPNTSNLCNLSLYDKAAFTLGSSLNSGRIINNGETLLSPDSENQAFTTFLSSGLRLQLVDWVYADAPLASWTISKGTDPAPRGGALVLISPLGENIPSLIADGTSVIFGPGAFNLNSTTSVYELPSSLTNLSVINDGLVGVVGYSPSDDPVFNNQHLAAVLGKITSPSTFSGTLSLEGMDRYTTRSFGGASMPIDLSASANALIGSNSNATILEGTALGFAGNYRFGGGSGILNVAASLTGPEGLDVLSDFGPTQEVYLSGANSFAGEVTVRNSILHFSNAASLPATATLNLETGGFVSSWVTPSGIDNFNNLLSRLVAFSPDGILGLELGCMMKTEPTTIDLSSLPGSLYLGTSMTSRISGNTTLLAPMDNTLKFTTVRSGMFIIDAPLSGALSLVYGHPNAALVSQPDSTYFGSYTITGNNTYTGGTTIYNGSFSLTNPMAFGSGQVDILSSAAPVQLQAGFGVGEVAIAQPIFIEENAKLILGNPSGGDPLNLTGSISGAGSIVTMAGSAITGSNNTYSGGTYVQQGGLLISGTDPLGTGDVKLTSGSSLLITPDGASLSNAVLFGDDVALNSTNPEERLAAPLSFSGQATAQANFLSTYINPGLRVSFTGGLSGLFDNTSWTFARPIDQEHGGLVILSGSTDSSISSITANRTAVVFKGEPSVTNLGNISAVDGGVIGVSGPGTLAENNALLTSVLSKITDPASFDGSLSLDSLSLFTTNSYGGTGYTLNLNTFTQPEFRLGSLTNAEIALGTTIIPPAGGNYSFGGNWGLLTVSANLDAAAGLTLKSPDNFPLTLRLQGTNTFTGPVDVMRSFLLLNGSGALPATATINLSEGGYAGTMGSTFATPGAFLDRINTTSISPTAIVGFDSADPKNLAVSLPTGTTIDLSALPISFFLGTTSKSLAIPFDTVLKAPVAADQNIIKFAAFQGASIDLSASLLTANNVGSVVYGHPDSGMAFDPAGVTGSYTIRSSNDYIGGTLINNGSFFVGSNTAFGTGAITFGPSARDVTLSPLTGTNLVLSNNIFMDNSVLRIGTQELDPTASVTLNGVLSDGPDSSYATQLVLSGNVTLNGLNTYAGGTLIDPSFASVITVSSNSAFGAGSVEIGPNATLVFATTTPVLNDLKSSGNSIFVQSGALLTINQTQGGSLQSPIVGGTPGSPAATNASVKLVVGDGTVTSIDVNGDSTYTGGTTLKSSSGMGIVSIQHTSKPLGTGAINLEGVVLQVNNTSANLINTLTFASGTENTIAGIGAYTSAGGLTIGTGVSVVGGVRDVNSISDRFIPGVLTFNNNLTFADGGVIKLMLQNPAGAMGVGYGSILVNGTIDFSVLTAGGFTVSPLLLDSFGYQNTPGWINADQTFSLLVAQATNITNIDLSKLSFDTSELNPGAPWSFSLNNTGSSSQIFLNFSPVPEPETWAMMLGGSAALLLSLRRKSKRRQVTGDRKQED